MIIGPFGGALQEVLQVDAEFQSDLSSSKHFQWMTCAAVAFLRMIDLDKSELRDRALELGFLDVRVASARAPVQAAAVYGDWIDAGHHGEMDYLERLSKEKQSGVEHVLPGAKSVIVLAASYYQPDKPGVPDGAAVGRRIDRAGAAAEQDVGEPSGGRPGVQGELGEVERHAQRRGLLGQRGERGHPCSARSCRVRRS